MKNPLILREAAQYFKLHSGKTMIIKFGGDVVRNEHFKRLLGDIAMLKNTNVNVIVVFGCGSQLSELLEQKGIPYETKDGIRQTSAEAAQCLHGISDAMAADMVQEFSKDDVGAVYLPEMITSVRIGESHTAKVKHVCIRRINKAFKENKIIIVGAATKTASGVLTNVNADHVAIAIAKKIIPFKFIFLSSIKGVLDADGELITELLPKEAKELLSDQTIHGGMAVKVKTCLDALQFTEKVHLVSGVHDGMLLMELFTNNGAGTQIVNRFIV